MTGLVLADRGRDLLVEGHTAVMRNAVKPELLAEVRKVLAGRAPLLLDELAFPPSSMASDAAAHAAYRASATLLCHELLGDRDGRAAFNAFLARNLDTVADEERAAPGLETGRKDADPAAQPEEGQRLLHGLFEADEVALEGDFEQAVLQRQDVDHARAGSG